ncbi:hypothetical protein FY528_14545 [Hymenobacter lutimineralis]|uniref:Uncharacterized protein n=1 Tax=Hymenobacter lutimineralis TaxID=2606448 RepID=A0A5D6UYI0_9BACT|nr:hypothetical protein [Hymenobacter lutimineralis]TYZ07579.1 hypothetical protein FY528_14545 [Hymenobacter lutimineralis]
MHTSTFAFSSRLQQLLRVAGLLLVMLAMRPATAQAQTWMVSTDAYIRLGVMDKFGILGTYTAKFMVTNQATGKVYILTKEIEKGQNGADVMYPADPTNGDYFKSEAGEAAKATPGRYVWECQVTGKRVVSGRFEFPETANDVTVVEKRK